MSAVLAGVSKDEIAPLTALRPTSSQRGTGPRTDAISKIPAMARRLTSVTA
jgi:hypothetical protein